MKLFNNTIANKPVELSQLVNFEKTFELSFPKEHKEALLIANGFISANGMHRLFGINSNVLDIVYWNKFSTWKYAWGNKYKDFLCFYENAFGDQYAYKISEMKEGIFNIYELDAIEMFPELIYESFEECWEEILKNEQNPFDSMIKFAIQKYKKIPYDKHIIHTPSILISNSEEIENTKIINCRDERIISGQLFNLLENEAVDKTVNSVLVNYEKGVPKVIINWKM